MRSPILTALVFVGCIQHAQRLPVDHPNMLAAYQMATNAIGRINDPDDDRPAKSGASYVLDMMAISPEDGEAVSPEIWDSTEIEAYNLVCIHYGVKPVKIEKLR